MEASNKEEDLLFKDSRLFKVLDVYQHTIQLFVMLPDPSRKPSGELGSTCTYLVIFIKLSLRFLLQWNPALQTPD